VNPPFSERDRGGPYYCEFSRFESRTIPNLHDSLLFHGMTDFRNKMGLVNKALIMYRISKDSRASEPIDIVRRIGAQVAYILDNFEA
jgi:hypothetical protein